MNPIEVELTSFYARQNAERDHHTESYDLVKAEPPTAILRRGENFYIFIRFKRRFDAKLDAVRVVFTFGPDPKVSSGTKAVALVRPPRPSNSQDTFPKDGNKWEAERSPDDREKTAIIVHVHIPPDAPVGVWRCSVQTNIYKNRDVIVNYEIPEDIYIIFNPWSPNDTVYMKDEEERNEYVLNETGKVFCGTFRNPVGRYWIFGQFDDIALPAAAFLLEKSRLSHSKRGNPVLVARAISAIVNSEDDDGLLVGRYDGNYAEGTSPHAWTGSAAILYEYLQSKGIPVKYGQCWVYSGVVVTICRALGIPCRSTTNYVSAHDFDSPFIERYVDSTGNLVQNGPNTPSDSCWSFHAWNDVWMKRPELPAGYDGWQVIDGTPLTKNDRLKRCGPAPVAAVKSGDIGYLYDTPLVFCEVNADIVHFTEDDDADNGYKRITTNKYRTGRKIVTKNLGPTNDRDDSDLLDITTLYKNPAGSKEEYEAISKAIHGTPNGFQPNPPQQDADVFFDLIDIDSVPFGDGFDLIVKVRNDGRVVRTITMFLSASSVYYTGKVDSDIKKTKGKFRVKPRQEETLKLHVTPEEYVSKLIDHGIVKLFAYATVEETGQVWSEEDDFTLTTPDMSIAVSPAVVNVGESCTVSFSFHNPLNEPLTDCMYTVEGPTNYPPRTVGLGTVQPKELVSRTDSIVASRKGRRRVITTFTSRQIPYISASTVIEVV